MYKVQIMKKTSLNIFVFQKLLVPLRRNINYGKRLNQI